MRGSNWVKFKSIQSLAGYWISQGIWNVVKFVEKITDKKLGYTAGHQMQSQSAI